MGAGRLDLEPTLGVLAQLTEYFLRPCFKNSIQSPSESVGTIFDEVPISPGKQKI